MENFTINEPLGPKLYDYTNYKSYLRAHVDHKKANSSHWSLGAWARVMNLKSKSLLTMILNNGRNPGPELMEKMAKYFKFNPKEKEYFFSLVLLEKSKTDAQVQALLAEKIKRLNPQKSHTLISDEIFQSIAKWQCYTIREMVLLPAFVEDHELIASQLQYKMTPQEIKRTINTLLTVGLLSRDESGKLVQTTANFTTQDEVASEALKLFHLQNIENASQAVRKFDVKERYLSGITITMKEENLDRFKAAIMKFEEEVIELFEETKEGDTVFQFNLQLFPMTKTIQGNIQ